MGAVFVTFFVPVFRVIIRARFTDRIPIKFKFQSFFNFESIFHFFFSWIRLDTMDAATENQMKLMAMKHGGLWQVYADQLSLLSAQKEKAEMTALGLISENTSLKLQQQENQDNIKRILLSLTDQSLSTLPWNDILQQVRQEREELQHKLYLYESQKSSYSGEIQSLHANIQYWQQKSQENDRKNSDLVKEIGKRDQLITSLEKENLNLQEKSKQLQRKILDEEDKFKVLKHSLITKDRQIKSLSQEKLSLESQLNTRVHKKPITKTLSSNNPSSILRPSSASVPEPTEISDMNKTPSKVRDQRQMNDKGAKNESTPTGVSDLDLSSNDSPFEKSHTPEINPWFKPVARAEGRTTYRKSATPTQMRRRNTETNRK